MITSRQIELLEADCEKVTKDKKYLSLVPLQNKHIFITGGTGFLGTWIAELITFVNKKYNFNTRLTLVSRNTEAFSKKAAHLAKEKLITLVSKDVRTLIDIPDDVSYVIHAAANPDSREHNLNPLLVIDTISNGTNNILEKSTRLGNLEKIVNVSSGLVYGAQPHELKALPETYFGNLDCSQISSIYAESKRSGEAIGTAYRSQYRLPIVTVRPFTFAGPYQLLDKPWAINNFIRDALLGGPIRILGNGETERSYMYGSDAAFWTLAMLSNGNPGACYNLGSPHPITLSQLANIVSAEFSPATQIISRSGNMNEHNVTKFIPDTTHAKKTLNVNITVPIDQAVKQTIAWNKFFR